MDDFLEPFLSSSSWANMNTSGTGRTSWTGAVVSQTDSLLADSVGAYNGDEKSPPIRMISSGHITRNIAAEEPNLHAHDDASSIFIGENLKYGISNGLFHGEDQPPHEGVIRSNSTSGSFDPELNTSRSVTLPYSALTESGSIKNNGSEASGFPHSLGDSHSVSSGPPMWPCSGVTSMVMGQGKLQGFGMQGLETDSNLVGDGNLEQLDSLTAASVHEHNKLCNSHLPSFTAGQHINLTRTVGLQPHQQEQVELHNPHLPSFVAGSQMTMIRDAGIPTRQQLLQSSEGNVIKHYTNHSPFTQSQPAPINSGACNGSMKPRIRARRGQATDPHSIAERLRREKIAERMKNLQELVPNSNKTDKASMLDEIIDYVKFLQLQVKVLSMSRLGAAGAVVPLITESQSEGSSSLLSPPVGQGGGDLSESQDTIAFEQEIVKLMESSVTTAMQFLQNKGLCLMPIALASAISSRKASSSAIYFEGRKPDVNSAQNSQGMMERSGREVGLNGCNETIVKQEEAQKSVSSMRELKPNA